MNPGQFDAAGSLAVVGPQADDWRLLLGAVNYAFEDGPSKGVVTILQGLQDALNATNPEAITAVDGCVNVSCADADLGPASDAASDAAASIVILGDWFGAATGWPLCTGDGTDGCESEAHDRTVIELPGRQLDVLKAVSDAKPSGAPLVCVLCHGGAVALGEANTLCDAIVDLWVPGQMGGTALADILMGDFSPAGRSPITFYQATSDLPDMGVFNEYPSSTSNGTTYRYFQGPEPTFKFGHGLSYTTFSYSDLEAVSSVDACDDITVTVTLTNTGSVASDEVVQVYVVTPESSVPSPTIRLGAFRRVYDVQPEESVTVSLTLTPESHAVVIPDADSVYVDGRTVESGTLGIHVGGSQPNDSTLKTQVTVATTQLLSLCASPSSH